MKRRTKTPKAKLKKYLDDLWKRLTKEIHGRTCWWCGKTGNVQSDHIQNRWKHQTRWRVENCAILCAGCHIFRKKRDPAGWYSIVEKRVGRDRLDALEQEANKQEKVDLDKVKDYLETIDSFVKEKNDNEKA